MKLLNLKICLETFLRVATCDWSCFNKLQQLKLSILVETFPHPQFWQKLIHQSGLNHPQGSTTHAVGSVIIRSNYPQGVSGRFGSDLFLFLFSKDCLRMFGFVGFPRIIFISGPTSWTLQRNVDNVDRPVASGRYSEKWNETNGKKMSLNTEWWFGKWSARVENLLKLKFMCWNHSNHRFTPLMTHFNCMVRQLDLLCLVFH